MAEGDYREVTVAGVTLQCAKGWELANAGSRVLEARGGGLLIHVLVPHIGDEYYLRIFAWPDGSTEVGKFVSELQARVVLLMAPGEVLEKYGRKGVQG